MANVIQVCEEAVQAARKAVVEFRSKYSDADRDACGFAWTTIYGVKMSTKEGKLFGQCGFNKAYGGGIQLWNPSGDNTQAITVKEVGARAAAEVFRKYGYDAYAGSRMD